MYKSPKDTKLWVICAFSHILKQSLPYTHRLNSICQIVCHHSHGVSCVIVDILYGKAEAAHLVHGLAVVIVPAFFATEIIASHCRCMLLYPRQLRHIGRCLFVRHVDAVAMLFTEDAMRTFLFRLLVTGRN